MPHACSSGRCDPSEAVELTDREFSVCQIICDAEEPVSFMEVKVSSGLHQEIVSRIVRRLVIHGLVTKEGRNYSGHCNNCEQPIELVLGPEKRPFFGSGPLQI